MSRKAIVTGGAGFVGSHLVDLLVDLDWELLVLDDLSSGHLEFIGSARRRGNVSAHVMDIRAPELPATFARFGPEVIFHLAAQSKVRPSVDDPVHDASVNVLGTINVLQGAVESGARKVVFASSGGAIYGSDVKLPVTERSAKRPDSPYGVSKKVVDDYFRWFQGTHGTEYVQLAFTNIFGPRQDPGLEGGVTAIFAQAMIAGRRPRIFGDGSQTRDFVFVQDAVDAFMRAADKGNGVLLNIGSGVETSVNDLYAAIAKATGFGDSPIYEDPKPGEVARSVIDASKAKKVIGWEAWTPLADGLEMTVDWFRVEGR